jgi:lipoprotein-anchoring transpeptidase ErfK/SrfK
MIRTPIRFVRGTTIALLLGFAPIYSVSAQESGAIEASISSFDPGEFVWKPELAPNGPIDVVVSIPLQTAYVYRSGTLIGASTVSTGKPGNDTPTGSFSILQKRKEHYSNLYDNAPMPFMQRLTWDGIALHAGEIPGYPASHGCVRLPTEFARKLFAATQVGAAVHIIDAAPSSPSTALAMARVGGTAFGSKAVELAGGTSK